MASQHPPEHRPDLHAVVEALAEAATALTEMPLGRREFPSRTALAALVEELRALLFPGYFGASELKAETLRYHLGARMDRVLNGLCDQIQRGMMASDPACGDCGERAQAQADRRIAEDHVAAGVIVGGPHASQLDLIHQLTELCAEHLAADDGGELGIAGVEVFH